MHNAQSPRNEFGNGVFARMAPLVLVVFLMAVSWTGLFVAVNDLIQVAFSVGVTDVVQE